MDTLDIGTRFIISMAKQIKHFYETPVIFVTKTNYSEFLFTKMCNMRTILMKKEINKDHVMDTIVDFHLYWLRSVKELQLFKDRVRGIPREEVFQAVNFTLNAVSNRLKYFQLYIEDNLSTVNEYEQNGIQADLEIIEDMHKEVIRYLLDKQKCFRSYIDQTEFQIKLFDVLEELLQWLDNINDIMSFEFSKLISVNMPNLTFDLTKTLEQIVTELESSKNPSAHRVLEELKDKGKVISTMIRSNITQDLEISKVIEKISVLADRIERLENENSSAVMGLRNKKTFLERRLLSLEKIKCSIISENEDHGELVGEECECIDHPPKKIFNHLLPVHDRERLIADLCHLWDLAVCGEPNRKSIISILSASVVKEEFTDELGTFVVDEHSRKIYTKTENDVPMMYQVNEENQLVPLTDDENHTYFYDACGRYFINAELRQRVYKAHANASEYMMNSTGMLLKVKEERDGIIYYYDCYGRYFINDEGNHIYRDVDSMTEYEHDGFGNLVRLRSDNDLFQRCPGDAHFTEDSNYLKRTVGIALRECIRDCILTQPADPIKYLAARLVKYRENIEIKEKSDKEKKELLLAREFRLAMERETATKSQPQEDLALGESEGSFDYNLYNYQSMGSDIKTSATASSKTDK